MFKLDILIDLEIISQIAEGDKLGVEFNIGKNRLVLDKQSSFGPLIRKYKRFNRSDSLEYLQDLLRKLIEYKNLLIKGSLKDDSQDLIIRLKKIIHVIDNLKLTYKEDPNYQASLEILKCNIEDIINELSIPISNLILNNLDVLNTDN